MIKLFVLVSALAVSLVACSSETTSDIDPVELYGSDTLQIFNWGEYIGEDVIENFEKEYNVKVSYSFFGSNEEMYTKLASGTQYDIIIPSDYMIERLAEEGYLQELDLDLIPNIENLTEAVQNPVYDPDYTYSVPYLWGSVGIVYDTTVISTEDVEALGWSIFIDEKYADEKIAIYDSERDSFMMAFKALGYSMNTEDEDEIQAAYEWLITMDDTISPYYVQDEVIDGMITGQYVMANVYSGDATYMIYENEDLAYYEPAEGTNSWIDAMVIPANANAPLLAHEFINYALSYEASYDTSEYVGYTSSNDEVMIELSSEDGEYAGISAYTPRWNYDLDEFFIHNEVLKAELSDLWIRVKNN